MTLSSLKAQIDKLQVQAGPAIDTAAVIVAARDNTAPPRETYVDLLSLAKMGGLRSRIAKARLRVGWYAPAVPGTGICPPDRGDRD